MVIFFRKYLQRCLASCYMHESPGSSIPVIYRFLSFSLHILGTQPIIWHLSSVQFSQSVMSDSLQPHGLQHARPPCPTPTAGVHPNSCPLSRWCHPTISASVIPFSSCSQSFQHHGLFKWVSSSHEVAKTLEFQLQHQSSHWTPRTYLLQDGLVGSPGSQRDSQESSPTPEFKSIYCSVLSFLYSPTLTFIHDYWKNHSLD